MRQNVLIYLLIFIFVPAFTIQADNQNVKFVGNEPFGPAYDVHVIDNYAYLCAGGSLIVLDLTFPENPVITGKLNTTGVAREIYLQNKLAYIADGVSGLRIIDISNPNNPQEIGFYDTPGEAYGVYVSGNYAYVADGAAGLRVINISNPANPKEVGFFFIPKTSGTIQTIGEARGVHVVGNTAYVAGGYSGLRIVDISDPSNPKELGFLETVDMGEKFAEKVRVSNNFAYVGSFDGKQGIFSVVVVSDPKAPRKTDSVLLSSFHVNDIFISGNIVWLVISNGTFVYIDVTIPNDIIKKIEGAGLEIKNLSDVISLAKDEYAYPCDTYGDAKVPGGINLLKYSIDSKSNKITKVTPAGKFYVPKTAYNVFTSGNYAYLANGFYGIRIINISDPVNPYPEYPEVEGYTPYSTIPQNIYYTQPYLFVARSESGLRIIDVSNPAKPIEVGFYDTSGIARDVYVSGIYAYIADSAEGLKIIDVSNPKLPGEVGAFKISGKSATSVYIVGNYAYIAFGKTLCIIDISKPRLPLLVGQIDLPEVINKVYTSDIYTYAACGLSGLQIVDISDPKKPKLAGTFDTPGFANGVYVAGVSAYIADGSNGSYIVDVSNPKGVKEIGGYDTPGSAMGVYVSGSYVYIADDNCGLCITTGIVINPVITTTAGKNGTINPSGSVTIKSGSDQTFTITPSTGYTVEDVKADGTSVGSVTTYTFKNVTSNHTISTSFKPIKYIITATVNNNGTIDPSDSVSLDYGVNAEFKIKPNEGFDIADVKVDGSSVGAVQKYTFKNVTENHTIEVIFAGLSSRSLIIPEVTTSPGGTAAVPINIDDIAGIASADITLTYDSKILTVKEVNAAALISGWNIVSNTNKPGEIILSMVGDKAIQGGKGTLVEIVFTVNSNVSLGTETPVTFKEAEIFNENARKVAVNTENGKVMINSACVKGDVNGDGKVKSNDVILALRIATGLLVPTLQQLCAADMTNDGNVKSNDAILILRASVETGAPDENPSVHKIMAMSVKLDEAHGVAGESITVPLVADNTSGLSGGDICITYDNTVLRAFDISSENNILLASNLTEPGVIRIAFANIDGLTSNIIAKIKFDILADKISSLNFKKAELYGPDALPINSKALDSKFKSWAIPPEYSALLQNYPNPFNPETWIPYQLKSDSDVTIRIYNISGNIIREFKFSRKSAGIYTTQDRAAYWDGKNEVGEIVTSGIYFYTINAGNFTATKKMLIQK